MTDYFSYTLDADAIRAISSIGLAHLGDAVYELLVRSYRSCAECPSRAPSAAAAREAAP